MDNPEFNDAYSIPRGPYRLDVVTNVVQTPDGDLVPLTDEQAIVLAALNPQEPNMAITANHVTSIEFELNKITGGDQYPSVTIGDVLEIKSSLQQILPDLP